MGRLIDHDWSVVEPYPSEKNEFVNWDDYSQLYAKMKNVPNHQPDRNLLKTKNMELIMGLISVKLPLHPSCFVF